MDTDDSVKNQCSGCSYKKSYSSKSMAKRFKRHTDRKYGSRSNVYKCKYCGMWHLATKPRQKRIEREAANELRKPTARKKTG